MRTDLEGNRVARIIFCFTGTGMILLHGFIKKTKKTSARDLEIARRRQREVAG